MSGSLFKHVKRASAILLILCMIMCFSPVGNTAYAGTFEQATENMQVMFFAGQFQWTAFENDQEETNDYLVYLDGVNAGYEWYSTWINVNESDGKETKWYGGDLNNAIDPLIETGEFNNKDGMTHTIELKISNEAINDGQVFYTWIGSFTYNGGNIVSADEEMEAGGDAADEEIVDRAPWDSNNWIRIKRDWADTVEVGDYYFYYENKNNGGDYDKPIKVYRENIDTGKRELLLKYKVKGSFPEFYTNGKKLVYIDYDLGSIAKVKDLKTKKTKTIVNLRKFRTSKSTDSFLYVHFYGNNLYYSKYRGLSTTIWKLYRVNINTGKQSTIKSGYRMNGTDDMEFAGGRYFLIRDKKGNLKVYDTKKKTIKTIGNKSIRKIINTDGYWYYLTCSKPNAKTKSYKVMRIAENGKGSAKKIAAFKTKYHYDDVVGFTSERIFFLKDESYSMEYNFAKKKMIKRKDQDVWYYIGNYSAFS